VPYAARMADLKPPRLDGDERDTLLALLNYQRESLSASRRPRCRPGASRRSTVHQLALVILHLARAEVTWVQFRFAG